MKKVFYMLSIVLMVSVLMNSPQPRALTAAEVTEALASSANLPAATISLNSDSNGAKSIAEAEKAGKMLFMYFHDGAEMPANDLAASFTKLMETEGASASYVFIDRKDEKEKSLVARFQLDRLPMPLILALAPNGAVTAGFPANMANSTTVSQAFVSKVEMEVLVRLQQGKLILLCVQNASSEKREEAMAGIKEYIADPTIASLTEIITVDPKESSEGAFFEKLRVTPDNQAQTVMLIPPGTIAGMFKGAVSALDLKSAFQAATRPTCGSGCGSTCGN